VVTNAHVVAGEGDTQVQVDGRPPGLDAQAVLFDPRNDVALLRVAGLGRRPLPLASHPRSGTAAAIMGYPENGPFRIRAGRIGRTQTVISNDAYGRGPIRRRMTPLRGAVRSGNSGGPMVDARGRVVTTVFAATTSGPSGGFGVPNPVVARAVSRAGGPVSTGPCAG
jgi:S1-C subfamily serine protease